MRIRNTTAAVMFVVVAACGTAATEPPTSAPTSAPTIAPTTVESTTSVPPVDTVPPTVPSTAIEWPNKGCWNRDSETGLAYVACDGPHDLEVLGANLHTDDNLDLAVPWCESLADDFLLQAGMDKKFADTDYVLEVELGSRDSEGSTVAWCVVHPSDRTAMLPFWQDA